LLMGGFDGKLSEEHHEGVTAVHALEQMLITPPAPQTSYEHYRWKVFPSLLQPRAYFTACWFKKHIFAIGGQTGACSAGTCEFLNLKTHEW